MSSRHDDRCTALSPSETRAHAHAERQRVKAQLASYNGHDASWADEVDEPGVAFKAAAFRDEPRHRSRVAGREHRHWKMTFWKRRSTTRRWRASFGSASDED